MRYEIQKRDKGVCALCGLDTFALQAEYNAMPKGYLDAAADARYAFLKEHGIPFSRSSSDWWDADHIMPVIEGGGECGLDNYRTLCIPCHKKVTKELHARMKRKRVEAKPLPLFD